MLRTITSGARLKSYVMGRGGLGPGGLGPGDEVVRRDAATAGLR